MGDAAQLVIHGATGIVPPEVRSSSLTHESFETHVLCC